jgi:hypothetical protein
MDRRWRPVARCGTARGGGAPLAPPVARPPRLPAAFFWREGIRGKVRRTLPPSPPSLSHHPHLLSPTIPKNAARRRGWRPTGGAGVTPPPRAVPQRATRRHRRSMPPPRARTVRARGWVTPATGPVGHHPRRPSPAFATSPLRSAPLRQPRAAQIPRAPARNQQCASFVLTSIGRTPDYGLLLAIPVSVRDRARAASAQATLGGPNGPHGGLFIEASDVPMSR